MKKVFLLLTIVTLSITQSFAQDSKGYIGVSSGVAAPTGDLADVVDSGLELGLINAGYRFNETWGATLNWGASGHVASDDDEIIAGVGYLGIGPMISFGAFDIKPQYAFVSTVVEGYGTEVTSDADSGFILGATYNFSLGGKWGVAANADYLNYTADDVSESIFKLSLGIRYNF
ncbi:hypothetical protein [Polaribacter sp.]|uniref:outer membrane beta-barrel protein n=1 Tax=Polaribacter sp. TaxID=1920175 RepID=UPI0025D91D14|nr:hypothetical protein [Polaribacter sp.]